MVPVHTNNSAKANGLRSFHAIPTQRYCIDNLV